jgi:hypothetical protein
VVVVVFLYCCGIKHIVVVVVVAVVVLLVLALLMLMPMPMLILLMPSSPSFHRSVIGMATAGTSKENLGVFLVSTDLADDDSDGVSGRLAQ